MALGCRAVKSERGAWWMLRGGRGAGAELGEKEGGGVTMAELVWFRSAFAISSNIMRVGVCGSKSRWNSNEGSLCSCRR